MSTEKRFLNVVLNKDGVIGPAMEAVRTAGGTIVVALRALNEADLSGPVEIGGPLMMFALDESSEDSNARRERYRRWLLAKGFQDLARGLRQSLEEAFLWNALLAAQAQPVPNGDFPALVEGIQKAANRMNFPDLMAAVNSGLSASLHWEAQFTSLQKVRNCLEHRKGVVSKDKDADANTGELVLSIPRLALQVETQGVTKDLMPGMTVEGGGDVYMRMEAKARKYAVGDRIEFSPEDFGEIAFACWIMVHDLAGKLPMPAAKP